MPATRGRTPTHSHRTAAGPAATSTDAAVLPSPLLDDRLRSDLACLSELERAWLPLALRGNAGGADRILTVHRHCAAVLQLALRAAAQAEQHAIAEQMASSEQRIVVHYVDDRRNAGQHRTPIEVHRTSESAREKGAQPQ